MKEDSSYNNFINLLFSKFPTRAKLVDSLLDILYISKEALYRRLRGDVPFTFQEICIISNKLGISLDNVISFSNLRSRPFHLKLTNFTHPTDIDYAMVEEWLYALSEIKDDPLTEYSTATKMIPDCIHLNFEHLTRFYFFKWQNLYENDGHTKKFQDIKATDRILKLLKEMKQLYRLLKKTYIVLDNKFIQYLIEDIRYFADINLLTEGDKQLLKKDLFLLIDYLEDLSFKGVNEEGNKISIFISNINLEGGFSYIDSQKYKITLLRSFTLYDVSSMDEFTLEECRQWMLSIIRTSTMISESGERERKFFFNSQREIIEGL